jgi:hypothetical protein
MNAPTKFLTFVLASSVLVGCESYRDTMHGLGSGMGAIQTRDIQQADAYRQALPGHLGLPPQQIRVEPGSGVTQVTISGITADAERQRIGTELATLNSKNPQLSPLKWRFQ